MPNVFSPNIVCNVCCPIYSRSGRWCAQRLKSTGRQSNSRTLSTNNVRHSGNCRGKELPVCCRYLEHSRQRPWPWPCSWRHQQQRSLCMYALRFLRTRGMCDSALQAICCHEDFRGGAKTRHEVPWGCGLRNGAGPLFQWGLGSFWSI